jgi:hypothetical protein
MSFADLLREKRPVRDALDDDRETRPLPYQPSLEQADGLVVPDKRDSTVGA